MYADTALAEYQQVVENLEEELGLANQQIVKQDDRYKNMEYLFSGCSSERAALTKENDKLKKKVRRNRILALSASGLGLLGWLLVLI